MSFLGLLQLVFILLKAFEVINWSWFIVFIPSFIGTGFIFLTIVIGILARIFLKD